MADLYSSEGEYQGTTEVIDREPVEYKVSYRNEQGHKFRLMFRQKPNPVGFVWDYKKFKRRG